MIQARLFPYFLQFSLDETGFKPFIRVIRSVNKCLSQPNTYTAYQLLITTTLMKATKDES